MARIRSLHPGYNRSEDIAGPTGLSYMARLHFAVLWTYSDDDGRGKDSLPLIKAECWPLDDDVTTKKIEAWMVELEKKGRIIRYEVDGRRYFEVNKWSTWQRPQKKRPSGIPPSPLRPGSGTPTVPIQPSGVTAPVGVEPVVGEGEVVVVVGEGEEAAPPPSLAPSAGFDAFWGTYPPRDGKRLNRAKAEGCWAKLTEAERIAAYVGAGHLAQAITAGGKFGPPDPDRWLRDRRWTEWQEPALVARNGQGSSPGAKSEEAMLAWLASEEARA